MNTIKFLPFVGENYSKGGIFGKRIMVLGDSHYCANESDAIPTLTQDVIKCYLDPLSENENWMQTYRKFERSLVGHETTKRESVDIWQSLLFYNYLQIPLCGPRVAGTKEQYADSSSPFYEILAKYSPEIIIVWGKRLWENLPSQNWIDATNAIFDNYAIENGHYAIHGNNIMAFCIYHPSVGYSWDWWYKIMHKFI